MNQLKWEERNKLLDEVRQVQVPGDSEVRRVQVPGDAEVRQVQVPGDAIYYMCSYSDFARSLSSPHRSFVCRSIGPDTLKI